MKKIFTLLLILCIGTSLMAQKPTAVIMKAETPPTINGEIDELWDAIEQENIDLPFTGETPTLGSEGETYWKALWDDDGIYVLVVVNDDIWVTGSPDWQYDKPEIYFDVNFIKGDALGPGTAGSGHYQISPDPTTLTDYSGTPSTLTNGTIWALILDGSAYVAEYFVPWSLMVDKDGILFIKTEQMGFDVTIIDNDVEASGQPGRNRAVWANIGTVGESWGNMDDCGLITFDGADDLIFVDDIVLTPAGGTITKNKGTLQLSAEITPEDASVQALRWEIVNKPGQTGMATVDNTGKVRGVADGEVTVRASATDGSFVESEVIVTLSNQMPTRWDFNHFRNGLLDEVSGTEALGWGGWIDTGGEGHGTRSLEDGVYVNNVTAIGLDGGNTVSWRFQTAQEPVYKPAENGIEYEFSFTAWAPNGDRTTMKANFEDPANNNARTGSSQSEYTDGGPGGRAEWRFPITTEPQRFAVDVTFDQILENTVQKFLFGLSEEIGVVMIDSILLIKASDLAIANPDDTYATFAVDYSVTGGNGTLTATVDGESVASGADVIYQKNMVFTATPAANYIVKQWTKDGEVIADFTATEMTMMVDDDTEITVEFQLGTSVILPEVSKLRVYPNPFNNSIYIDNADGFATVAISNIVGQKIMETNLNDISEINTADMKPGIYFLVFESVDGQRLVRKVVKR